MESEFASYLKDFVETSAQPADGAKRVFLMRNFPAPVRANSSSIAPPIEGAELTNGLECKLNCSTSKVSTSLHLCGSCWFHHTAERYDSRYDTRYTVCLASSHFILSASLPPSTMCEACHI